MNRLRWVALVLIAGGLLGVDLTIHRALVQQSQAEERAIVHDDLATFGTHLEAGLNANLHAVRSMADYLAIHPEPTREAFEGFARRLQEHAEGLRNLVAAPGLTIRHVYPREGNTVLLGVSYYDLPEQLPMVLKARDRRQLVMTGPSSIVQGGQGILARVPVYVDGPDGERFWGIVASWIDLEAIVAPLQPMAERRDRRIAIRAGSGEGDTPPEQRVVYGDAALFSGDQALVRTVRVANGDWTIAMAPKAGWTTHHSAQRLVHGLLGTVAVLLLGVSEWHLRKNRAVQINEQRLRDLTLHSSNLVWETDRSGRITYFVGHSESLLGTPPERLIGRSILELSDPTGRDRIVAMFQHAIQEGIALKDREIRVPSESGTIRYFLRSGVPVRGPNGTITGYRGVDKDITTTKELEEAFQENAALMDALFQQSLDGCFFMMLDDPLAWDRIGGEDEILEHLTRHQRLTKVNEAMLQQYRTSEAEFLGIRPIDLYSHDPTGLRQLWRRLLADGRSSVEAEQIRMDGTEMMIEGNYGVMMDGENRIIGHFGIQRDVTDEREAAIKWERYVALVDQHIMITQTDLLGRIVYVSDAFANMSGFSKAELLNRSHRIIRHPMMPTDFFEELWSRLGEGKSWRGEIQNRAKQGGDYWLDSCIFPLFDRKGHRYGYMAVYHDITAQKQLELASITDGLTGLFNRQKLDRELEIQRERYERYDEPVSLILIDVDRFKTINDRYGHLVGDVVLRRIAEGLRETVRTPDIVGRWGGEEFLIICPHTVLGEAVALAERIREAIIERASFEGRKVTISLGVAPLHDGDTETLIREADRALYRAKSLGRDRVVSSQGKDIKTV